MAEPDFDTQLSRLFAESPHFPDADIFASDVGRRLDRGWAVRRLLIGAAGVVAGLVAAAQLVTTRLANEVKAVSEDVQNLDLGYHQALASFNNAISTPASTETMWLVAALAVVGLAFAVTRAVEEL
jgi:hypothetical protein